MWNKTTDLAERAFAHRSMEVEMKEVDFGIEINRLRKAASHGSSQDDVENQRAEVDFRGIYWRGEEQKHLYTLALETLYPHLGSG